jgi:hypothetical protein
MWTTLQIDEIALRQIWRHAISSKLPVPTSSDGQIFIEPRAADDDSLDVNVKIFF